MLISPTHTIHWPGSETYEFERRAFNLHSDQRPACVCVATSVGDVQAAVAFARSQGLRLTPQSTGHLSQTLGDLSDTLLLRLKLGPAGIVVDPQARTVRVPAGSVWGDVVEAVAPHGLAVMHGSSPTVGVIGYLLGGGLSFYGRRHGLAANHVIAFDVVTPDGVARRVDAVHHRDLFYALRGGGGGYAVVTEVELGLLPYPEVTGGALFFPAADAGRLLRLWRNWTVDAPESITTTFRLLCLPPVPEVPEPLRGVPTVCVNGVSLDPPTAERLELRLTSVARPIVGGFGAMPSSAVVRLHGDPEQPAPFMGDGMLLERLDDWAIESFLRVAGPGSPLLAAELRQLGGALATPPVGAGARGHLEGRFLLFGVGIPGMPAPADELGRFLDRYLDAMRPWATGTRFTSFAERTNSLASCVPKPALARLGRIRAAVDAGGLLRPSHLPS
jgi:hypothetical protein